MRTKKHMPNEIYAKYVKWRIWSYNENGLPASKKN